MRILKKRLRQGIVKVLAETPDDLWYLYTIVDEGDVCTGSSEYKYKIGERSVRKRVWISLRVEKREFRQQTGQLRLSGSVLDGSEEVPRGSAHSLDVQPGAELEIRKEQWLDFQLERLEDALRAGTQTLVVLFDRESALFALLRPNGYEILSRLRGSVQKKAVDDSRTRSFYTEIVAQMREYLSRFGAEQMIAASPSFWKEYLRKVLPDDLKRRVVFASVSSVDEPAITELLTSAEMKQALSGERAAREACLVETAMEALSKDRLVYGMDDLQSLVKEGNLSLLLVTEKKIMETREEGTFKDVERLMQQATVVGARVHLLSLSERIDGLGGIVAVKRW